MLKMLDDYILHIKESDNNSLLARFYGIFTIKSNYFPSLDVVVMQNTINRVSPKSMVMKFDLKGSTMNRYSRLP
jgi:Phosphatidylinositol-4-phosphate 5-Kinase